MSKRTQDWGWKMLRIGHERRWPYFVTRMLNDIGNYGLRGTFRECVIREWYFWFRNRFWWKFGLHKIYPHFRVMRGIPYKPRELRYSQTARCRCGAGLAYYPAGFFLRSRPAESHGWVCVSVLTGRVPIEGIKNAFDAVIGEEKGESVKHDYYPFNFYEIRSEDQPNRNGVRRKVLGGLLGDRYASCREIGNSTRFL